MSFHGTITQCICSYFLVDLSHKTAVQGQASCYDTMALRELQLMHANELGLKSHHTLGLGKPQKLRKGRISPKHCQHIHGWALPAQVHLPN